jgi:thiol-disulfide isomerase/thioredoxin
LQERAVRYALFVLLAALAFAAGVRLRTASHAPAPVASNAVESLFALALPDLEGQPQRLEQWRGKLLVVNFWATWCAPCREEIPVFVKLQQKHAGAGLQFLGISIDQVDKTAEFSANFKINYPILIGTFDTMKVSRQFGNSKGVLPYTVIIDRKGNVVATEVGGLTMEKMGEILGSLL